jgi:hypothetical protein
VAGAPVDVDVDGGDAPEPQLVAKIAAAAAASPLSAPCRP